MNTTESRREFEEWITAMPYERDITRRPNDFEKYAFPNTYVDYQVDLAWEAWQAARERQDKDSQRLDWLQSNQKTVWRVSHEERRLTTMLIPATTTVQVFDGWTVDDEENPKQTIREAIDQAMNPPTSENV